jgi:predicted transport protein
MPIFQYSKGKLKKLRTSNIASEKELQTLVENNLLEIFDMHFLASEYTTTFGGRIDTLAVDSNGAPVIIEYKKNKNDNVINQGLSYLRWLQAQKVEFFEMLLIKKLGDELGRKIDVDWKNPRVICIAESYNKFDLDTVEVLPMRLELFRYRNYEDNIFSLEPLGLSEQKAVSGETKAVEKPIVDIKAEDHLKKAPLEVKILFNNLRERIFSIDQSITEKATSQYIVYKVAKNFAEVYIGKNQIKLHLRPAAYDDPKGIIEIVPERYQWTLSRRLYLKNENGLDYVMGIIEQSYRDVL